MRPRILLRTHYQGDEPRLIIAAVTQCSSPTESRNEDGIAAAFERWAHGNGYVISTPGAIYVVGNARHLGLLNKSNRWTASGLAFAFLGQLAPPGSGPQSRLLTPVEERLYFKIYLAGAGALLIRFANWLLERGSTTAEHLRNQSVIEKLMLEVLDEYLRLTTEIRDRTAIRRERDRLNRANYAASTKRHKRYPLLKTMERLRLCEQVNTSEAIETIRPDADGRLAAMSRAIPDVEALERLLRTSMLQDTLDIGMREYTRQDLPSDEPSSLLLRAYTFALDSGLQACPLNFLDDVLTAVHPASLAVQRSSAETILQPVHRARPGEVRFHVDRRGRRAFVLLSKSAIAHLKATSV